MNQSKDLLSVLGRVMAVGLFFTSGVDKIAHYSDNLQLMASNNVPGFFLPLVILLEVGGGLAIALGFLTRFTAIFMAVFGFPVLPGLQPCTPDGVAEKHLLCRRFPAAVPAWWRQMEPRPSVATPLRP